MRWGVRKHLVFGVAGLGTAFDLIWVVMRGPDSVPMIGLDYNTYIDATARWLSGGVFYQPYQLAGPYEVAVHEILYPPNALIFFAPFTVLPAVFWWAIPTSILGWCMWSWRPTFTTSSILLPFVLWPWTLMLYAYGNPSIWITAGIAAGLQWRWPLALIALKPQFAPVALIGARSRSWWIVAAILAAASLAMLPMWFDYETVLRNARWDLISPFYWLNNVPMLLVPLIAWLGGSRSRGGHRLVVLGSRLIHRRPSGLALEG